MRRACRVCGGGNCRANGAIRHAWGRARDGTFRFLRVHVRLETRHGVCNGVCARSTAFIWFFPYRACVVFGVFQFAYVAFWLVGEKDKKII